MLRAPSDPIVKQADPSAIQQTAWYRLLRQSAQSQPDQRSRSAAPVFMENCEERGNHFAGMEQARVPTFCDYCFAG
ncbi:hypothetical protein, partial [Sedimenticola sp.]|uniref:hypothetical protein n=1 Tax=Sedimenticola sp. TaxID=1940285 RepID=UPI00258BA375